MPTHTAGRSERPAVPALRTAYIQGIPRVAEVEWRVRVGPYRANSGVLARQVTVNVDLRIGLDTLPFELLCISALHRVHFLLGTLRIGAHGWCCAHSIYGAVGRAAVGERLPAALASAVSTQ
jgi:hypothetical protein